MKTFVNFQNFNGRVYVGRARGENARQLMRLDAADKAGSEVDISIPDGTYTVTSSFFLGLFGPSVVMAGSKEAFMKRFHFLNLPEYLRPDIDKYIGFALQSRDLLE